MKKKKNKGKVRADNSGLFGLRAERWEGVDSTR